MFSSRKKVVVVVGTRPNFMKMAPIQAALAERPESFDVRLVHTGQHYDAAMSDVFLEQLGLGAPDHLLNGGSGSHAVQTARVMEYFDAVLDLERPDAVLVPGDVNSTLAAALVASKRGILVGHVEAGLRSFDRSMPEEINRLLTDRISDLLFTHSPEAAQYLLAEGCDASAIHYVGNTMIDTLVRLRARIDAADPAVGRDLESGGFLLVTLHRPALVDGPMLGDAIDHLAFLAREMPVVFPAHPRTRQAIERLGLGGAPGLRIVDPLSYVDFLHLLSRSAGVLTDSGGIQEEATYLGIPCLTLRDNTERPVTISMGTNMLVGLRPERILDAPVLLNAVRSRPVRVPTMWDGLAAERIVDVLAERLPERDAPPMRTGRFRRKTDILPLASDIDSGADYADPAPSGA